LQEIGKKEIMQKKKSKKGDIPCRTGLSRGVILGKKPNKKTLQRQPTNLISAQQAQKKKNRGLEGPVKKCKLDGAVTEKKKTLKEIHTLSSRQGPKKEKKKRAVG